MPIIFRYIHVKRSDGTLRHAPYIPIYVKDKEGRLIKLIALIDSGADVTVIPKDLAEVLGIKKSKEYEETGGIGGSVKVNKSKLSFRIRGGHESYPLNIPVLILQDKKNDVPLLLGRNGFFENFHITFKQNEEKIILKKIQLRSHY